MTEHLFAQKQKNRKAPLTFSRLCLGWLGLFCLILMLRNSAVATEYIARGLRLCAKTIVPTLFPFMAISELALSSGVGAAMLRPLATLCRPVFRLSEQGCCAVFMGMLCGFPIGARCATAALKDNRLTNNEALRVLLFSTNPSTAFLINTVGVSLWGIRRVGVALCIVTLISQLVVGLLFTHVFLPKEQHADFSVHVQAEKNENSIGISKLFTQAIGSACSSILLVCAYVVFFSALSGVLHLTLNRLSAPTILQAIIACFLELSGGVSIACGLSSVSLGMALCAFAAGWCGVSVHCQLLSICDGHDLMFRYYFLAKLLQGLLCALLILAWTAIDPSLLIIAKG